MPSPLYPFTYDTDREEIARKLAEIDRALGVERRCLHAELKFAQCNARVVARFRTNIERFERYRRNGETRLREITPAGIAHAKAVA